ncbi:FtsX-like permease family protein [Aquicoccus sp. SCR17]|nr:FtsX-like permease family protein [Carideicomes alvinocaridis]
MVKLHALDRKLLRDVWRLRAQALAIALVLGCGVAIFLTAFGMVGALEATRAEYYAEQRFADIFASARRAPNALLGEMAEIDGVRAVEGRATGWAVLDLPGRAAAASGRILSLPPEGARINVPLLVEGRLPDPDADREVAVTARFAAASGLRPGDSFAAIVEGHRLELVITGAVRTPEFIYALPPGGLMPDDEGFAVIWMPERAAASALGLSGAFNDVALTLRRGADPAAVIEAVDRILSPWGGSGAHERDLQTSHAFIDAEISQLRSMAVVLPPVFFGIAAFLVNIVLGRIVALERAEIGLLKALGYRNREIAVHYLAMAGLIAVAGTLIGWGAGTWLARGMAGLYARFYDFPWLVRPEGWDSYAWSGLIGLAAASLGALRSALAAARLAPAVAMAPPAPPRFRRSIVDRAAERLNLSQPGMMVLRGLLRWPLRAAMTSLGLAFGVAILVASSFMTDALDRVIDIAFFRTFRQHATLALAGETPLGVTLDAAHLPGVLRAEPQYDLPVTLRHGHLSKRLALNARPPGGELMRVLDTSDRPVELPPEGMLISRQLADQLSLVVGDMVLVEPSERSGEGFEVPVAAVTGQYLGLGAYMDLDALSARLRQAPRVTSVSLALDPAALPEFRAATKQVPRLAFVIMLHEVRDSFRDTISENVGRNTLLFVTIAVLITVGVAYNGARIQLSERARELASLRILGFTRSEVSFVLLGETAVLALLAQPLGWAIGSGIAVLMVNGFDSDLYRVPLVLTPANFATASLVTLGATAAAALLVRRRVDRFDLVSVLKTRE